MAQTAINELIGLAFDKTPAHLEVKTNILATSGIATHVSFDGSGFSSDSNLIVIPVARSSGMREIYINAVSSTGFQVTMVSDAVAQTGRFDILAIGERV